MAVLLLFFDVQRIAIDGCTFPIAMRACDDVVDGIGDGVNVKFLVATYTLKVKPWAVFTHSASSFLT
jgi:hypothetical protein